MTTPAPRFTVHPSAREPGDGVWFATPAGFLDLRLDAFTGRPDSPSARSTAEALASVLSAAPDDVVREVLVTQLTAAQQMLRALRSEGASHCSLGLHRDDTGGADKMPLVSLFTVTWVDVEWAPRGITVGRAVVAAEGHTNIEYAELPCGPATFSELLRLPVQESGLPQNPLLQVHAHLAHPDGRSLVLLTLSTTALAHREHYRAILRQIAQLASFDDPFDSAVPEVADQWS
ncbi:MULTISPECIES: hypothetical protein [unclassified Streptomyces]|uniref:hypothetical protein n=1 Tax=unclassified Streptomyces TaxID=2593676 RepID=UPI00225C2DDA|nr:MULTISPECIES: hypothetical protein [unclassified Streptomyces]MCX4990581.1 hypothetical protein [Streptomyces sp. NBC_00568]MCX5004188.1 hypothetical protein [Streptomyces sp. NBC_00638]